MKFKHRYNREAMAKILLENELDKEEFSLASDDLQHIIESYPEVITKLAIEEFGIDYMITKVLGLEEDYDYKYDYTTHEYVTECEL